MIGLGLFEDGSKEAYSAAIRRTKRELDGRNPHIDQYDLEKVKRQAKCAGRAGAEARQVLDTYNRKF